MKGRRNVATYFGRAMSQGSQGPSVSSSMRRAFPLALFAGLAACPPKEDVTPQIEVSPHAAERMNLIPSRARREAAKAAAKPARVHPLAKGDELGGPNAVGRVGDIVLENDDVVFVVDQLGGGAGFAESGGNLVDAADARARKDELGMLFTYFGTFPRQGVYGRLTSGTGDGGAAWVEAKGHELYEKDLEVTTRYTLRPGDRALLLETTLTNKSDHPIDKLGLGDALQWGGAEKTAPGKPLGFRGPSHGPYIGGVGRLVAYAITSTEGEIDAVSGGSWTDTEQRKDLALKPGESVQYARVFLVGARADTASLVAELIMASPDAELGRLELELHEGDAVAPSFLGAKASLFVPGGGEVLTLAGTEGEPLLAGDLPPGKYEVAYAAGGGRAAAGAKVAVEVRKDQVTHAVLPVTRPGRLALACAELAIAEDGRQNRVPSSCKITLEGTGATPSPDFGPAHTSGPARNQVTTHDGKVDLPLAVGTYRITVSRGPEYATRTFAATLRPGETWTAGPDDATLSRVVDTGGYVSTDFHQHTMLGADSPVGLRDRVVGNAAEGLEIAVASEHNVVADLSGIVKELHLEPSLVELAGDELTTDSSRRPWGHANVFPLPFEPDKARGGAPDVRDRGARELFAEIRARHLSPAPIFQINHPRTKITGYFDQLGFDAKTGVGTDPAYDPDFDALEVWNGRNVDGRDKVLADYFALLRTRHPVTATADTDTHGIVGQEAGYPRTYVRVADDRHLDAWSVGRTGDLLKGVRELRDVVLTNGPFLRVTANGAPIGGVANAKGQSVTFKIHVEHAPWLALDRVRVVSARTGAELTASPALAWKPTPLPSGAVGQDLVTQVRFAEDDAVIVVAEGATPMAPVLSGEAKEIAPWAMTGAIWIDANGDGESLGRRGITTAWPKPSPSSPTPAAAPAKKP
jgi:hypothetical protein